ncbi:hypothetical protein CJ030_MR6G005857 [Morella rubra]|uniref:Heavy metal-associated isoprenylated plant protein 16 n=1 Tax=Morella rubra TaxID=262757 RepID=A0A6A1VA56_9ROSI|nr:hypothetical protein CJ030_MR6G005857 [Morella rubra]
MKQTVVIKVSLNGQKSFFGELDEHKARSKAFKIAVGIPGVESVSLKGEEKDQMEVKGDGIDTVKLTTLLRKNLGRADIVSVAEDKKEDQMAESILQPMVWSPSYGGGVPSYVVPMCYYQDSYSTCSIS